MKQRLLLAALILMAAVLAGALAFVAAYRGASAPDCCRNHSSARELGWLRQEYQLSDAQFERIVQLHTEYAPRCAEMCQRVRVERARLARLIQEARATTPEVAEALQQTAALELQCRQATLAHIYAVAAEMPPGEGRRYVAALSAAIVAPGMPGKTGDCAKACEMPHSR